MARRLVDPANVTLVDQYYPAFLARVEAEGRILPDYVQQEFTDYLKCGRLEHGFLRVSSQANQRMTRDEVAVLDWLGNQRYLS